jgi:hypothetical protein
VELLVRVAAAKHVSLGRTTCLGEAVEMLCQDTISRNLPAAVAEDRSVWRNARLYTEGMDAVWRHYMDFIKLVSKVYRRKATAQFSPSMQVEQFEKIIDQLQLYSAACTIQGVRNAFLFSQMLTVDNIGNAWKAEGLQFVEFLEAVARVAELWNLPSAEEIAGGTLDGEPPHIVAYLEAVRMDAGREVVVPAAKDRPPEHGLEAFLDLIARKIFSRSSSMPEGEEYNMPRVIKIMTSATTRVG